MLLLNNYGISWSTYPRPGAPEAEQIAAQLDICWAITSTVDTIANQTMRATYGTEQEFGPDFVVTLQSNGWARMRLSRWPILQIVSGQVSSAGTVPPSWTAIPATQMMTEHASLPALDTITASGAGGPTAVLIPPGYVNWFNGRNGYVVSVSYVNGYPLTGIDQSAIVGATAIHVDDITGWWNGTGGARGTIQDGALRESVVVTGVTPDVVDAVSGPGTLTINPALRFAHTPVSTGPVPDQTILFTAMPPALLMACYYLGVHYGLIRGATASTVQVRTPAQAAAPTGMRSAQTWYELAENIIGNYARVI